MQCWYKLCSKHGITAVRYKPLHLMLAIVFSLYFILHSSVVPNATTLSFLAIEPPLCYLRKQRSLAR